MGKKVVRRVARIRRFEGSAEKKGAAWYGWIGSPSRISPRAERRSAPSFGARISRPRAILLVRIDFGHDARTLDRRFGFGSAARLVRGAGERALEFQRGGRGLARAVAGREFAGVACDGRG